MNLIYNFKFQISSLRRRQKGFTLIEVLASVIVLVAIGSVIAGVVTSSFRGVNKTNTIENIRQNGNYVISQMSKNIGYAQDFDGKNTGFSNDDINYSTACQPFPNPTPFPVTTTYKYVSIMSANKLIKYNCAASPPVLSVNGTSLIDISDISSIALTSCSLNCVQTEATGIPIIKISFTLEPKSKNNLVENSSPPVIFETSVALKNYQK